ncbi:uncharacterized protein LOC127750894 [Frankliniella occidentalis]|uniref:Uncharacterized protein LOC127750894 n=1 Tax=Frankliniella occidentalis TaxID=133901 RepID=A0A9C6XSZ2_FRAOC|nr:uncharacterized protein LOC127750894 [Frankliniella occidentalis]
MSYLAAALGVDRAMRYLSDDSLYSENSNGMRKAVSSFDVFRRASDVSMVVVSTEDVAEAVAAEEKQAAAARAGRERQASVGSNTSRGSNGSAGRVRRRRTVSTRARAGTSGATSAAANKRKSLPLFAMKLFGRKGSSSGEEITMSNLDLDTVNDHGGSSSNETSSTPASPNGDLYA